MEKIAEYFDKKDDVSLGKLLKEVENETPISFDILKHSSMRKGKAHIVGITGPPGSGKSTLVSKICKQLAAKGLQIGVVCIDPTSPFTQGALLGDRIRMQELAKTPNVFIKSLATRGNLGGLAASAADVVQVLDAYEKDVILIETVGVGQVEFDVLGIADTIVLVNVPGLGDTLQTLKAGIMEIADLYVINQADRPGANESVKDLKMMIRESGKVGWQPPILQTVATEEKGVKELIESIHEHKAHLKSTNLWKEKRQERNVARLDTMIQGLLSRKVEEYIKEEDGWQHRIQEVKEGKTDPFTVSHEIVNGLIHKNNSKSGGRYVK
ncbi:methylmalonyl Co-A mutase-associated GTPase MeaB [Bacillus thermotolerans]|uniref:Periplasmic protein kinase ArgK n=1 Tax=Bacillus thermotolerans TaxID=1221996 RepID=A0A0F5HWT9_BACTR|nr:methylmalonyl Co-A mutase-associated GTPase MeaB [Bacillus thermotolerans]KKB34469.1 putative periplasmic protein kinase ArgK [Bacillus thermotolerans]KKB37741.1 putative periplasmic protein kinase ArgK [Bacillus thermotolerans]KKB37849.1 putative periplasmic protein kinase ArgK [Bacillus thermotolerans]